MSKKFIDFEDYLRGDLTEKELQTLENNFKEDNELKMEFEEYREFRKMIKSNINTKQDSKPLVATLESIQGKYFKEAPKKKEVRMFKLNRRLMSIAASVLVLFAAGFYLQDYADEHYSNTSIAQANQELKDLGLERSEDVISSLPIASFLDKDFNETIEALKDVSPQSENYPDACYMMALSHYGLEQYDQAIDWNLKLAQIGSKEFKDYADWNLVNCYLMTDQKAQANALLEKISNDPNHNFVDKSKRSQDKLNSFMHWIASTF